MQLDRLAVELRPRTPWEAVDLGCTMVRTWWRPLYAAWLAVLLPAAVVAFALAGGWGLLLLWWAKPLLDRIPLHVLGRAVFGELPTLTETLRRAPRLLVAWPLDALFFRRFDPARSFHLPTWQLEGLRGRERSLRARVLDADGADVGSWLTATSIAFESGLAFALLGLAPLLTPEWAGLDWGLAWERRLNGAGAEWLDVLLLGAPLLAFALLEPFYVGAGFALYLNRRTRLEGWDLEIAFRRLAARARQERDARAATERAGRGRRGLGAAGALLALVSLLGGAEAAGAPPSARAAREPAAVIEEVLADEAFERETSRRTWRLREDLFEGSDRTGEAPAVLRWAALLLEALLWITAGLLLLWLIVRGLRFAGLLAPRRPKEREEAPRLVAGHDISPESLPEDPAAEARVLWLAGRRAEALGLLYRASLATLVDRDGLALKESFTEQDCLEAARSRLAPARAEHFRALTRAWQSAAYAHRPPGDEEAEPLWRDWPRHFGRAA